MSIRLVLAVAHPVLLLGLEQCLWEESAFQVLARCPEAGQTLEAVRLLVPDVLLLDADLPGNLRVAREIQAEGLGTRVVLLADEIGDDELLSALRLGVRGVLLKGMEARLVKMCLRKVSVGEPWVERTSYSRALEAIARRDGTELTDRERAIVRLAVQGKASKEIARELGISSSTVKIHLHNVYSKLRVEGRSGLAHYARREGLI
jgi:DNA-binding NarL/FixJ family response regulator